MKGTFPINSIEKTGLIFKLFIWLGNVKIKIHFRNKKSITFFASFPILLFDSGVCLPFYKGNELNLKKKPKVKPRKNEIEPEQILKVNLNFFLKSRTT